MRVKIWFRTYCRSRFDKRNPLYFELGVHHRSLWII